MIQFLVDVKNAWLLWLASNYGALVTKVSRHAKMIKLGNQFRIQVAKVAMNDFQNLFSKYFSTFDIFLKQSALLNVIRAAQNPLSARIRRFATCFVCTCYVMPILLKYIRETLWPQILRKNCRSGVTNKSSGQQLKYDLVTICMCIVGNRSNAITDLNHMRKKSNSYSIGIHQCYMSYQGWILHSNDIMGRYLFY